MDNWYIVTLENNNAEELLHMFWEFHDFRIIDVNYSAKKDYIDVLFEYDDEELRVLLRFEGKVQMFVVPVDFEEAWITGAALHSIENQLQWSNFEMDEVDLMMPNKKATYFRGNQIKWAILDQNGNRLPVPDNILHQCWNTLNYETGKYEEEYHDFTVIPANNEN